MSTPLTRFLTNKPRAAWRKPTPRAVIADVEIPVAKIRSGRSKIEPRPHRFHLTKEGVIVHRLHTRAKFLVPWKQIQNLAQREPKLFL